MDGGGDYLIQDPYHDYAMRLMAVLRERFGWRAVAYYTDRQAYRMNAYRFHELTDSELVAASYRAELDALADLVAAVRDDEHPIRAVVPHFEPAVQPASYLAAAFDLSWSQPEVLARFRDKHAFKAHLAAVDPQLRINATGIVHSSDEALAFCADHDCQRFVLKPNDGFGNVDVGIFDHDVPPEELAEWWQGADHSMMLAEEYIGGAEYHCDGQVDADGTVHVLLVQQYIRGGFAGKENLELGSQQVPATSDAFRQLSQYAARVVQGSGLRRSPFHCEVKIDDRGPCLIECAARLVGQMTAPTIGLAHAGGVDPFALAAHYYATDADYGPIGTDWQAYDSRRMRQVVGMSTKTERVKTVTGVHEVEQLPSFVRWLKPIEVGQRLHTTEDIFGSAYIALLQATDAAELERADAYVRERVQWNDGRETLSDRVGWAGLTAVRRLQQLPGMRG